MTLVRIFIGYDPNETVAYHVLCHSILRHSSVPVSFTPLIQNQLRTAGLYGRTRNAMESTEFSFTRFLVPHLSGYEGVSLFLDCDMLMQSDVAHLWDYALAHPAMGVLCVKHDYQPKTRTKFLGQPQTAYHRKNWSSVMLFNNDQCRTLTPEYVTKASGLELHQFHWMPDEQIGGLPLSWNWLVDEYEPNPDADLLHYTLGTPCFADYAGCTHAEKWHHERGLMLAPWAGVRA